MKIMEEHQKSLFSRYPRSANYDPQWVKKNSMGENVLFNLESLTQVLTIKEGMRVLDLACGKAVSSIFLAKEFGVQVWAVDEAVPATKNYERILESGYENKAFPLQLDARNLPFPEEFFDVVIVIDSYTYFGTDDKYLPYITRFIKPGGSIGIVDVCFTREIDTFEEVPEFLKKDYQAYWYYIHSIDWWKKLWEKTGLVKVTRHEVLPEADNIIKEYIKDYRDNDKEPFAKALKNDTEGLISMFRLVGKRTGKDAYLQDYSKK
jgi:cyclopropane fatty-acyl-phospholipid synthase-like methyltransferase